jgi:hypothetical protein
MPSSPAPARALADAAQAIRYLEEGRTRGKVVIEVADAPEEARMHR